MCEGLKTFLSVLKQLRHNKHIILNASCTVLVDVGLTALTINIDIFINYKVALKFKHILGTLLFGWWYSINFTGMSNQR